MGLVGSEMCIRDSIKGPNTGVALQALTVLEALVKNCKQPFHIALAERRCVDALTFALEPRVRMLLVCRSVYSVKLNLWFLDVFRS